MLCNDITALEEDTRRLEATMDELSAVGAESGRLFSFLHITLVLFLLSSLGILYYSLWANSPQPAIHYAETTITPLDSSVCPPEPLRYNLQADFNNTPNVVQFYRTVLDVDQGRTVAWFPSREAPPVSIQLEPISFNFTATVRLDRAMTGNDIFLEKFNWYNGNFVLQSASVSAANGGDVDGYAVPFTVNCP